MSTLIAYRNLADASTITASSIAGNPADNLKIRQLSTNWRAIPPVPSPVVIGVDLGFTYNVSLIALLACVNIDYLSSTVRVSEDGVIWSAPYSLTGGNDEGVPDLPRNTFKIFDSATLVQFVELSVVSESGDPSGVVGAGRLWVGDAFSHPDGADTSWSLKTIERGSVDESEGLEVYPSTKPRGRELRMSFTGLDSFYAYGVDADGLGPASNVPSLQDLHTHVGAIGEVIAMPRSVGVWPRRAGIYGRLSEDSLDIRHEDGPNFASDVRVIEER
jgi:hypothetical protein